MSEQGKKCIDGCVYSIWDDYPADFITGCEGCEKGSKFTTKKEYEEQRKRGAENG
ncbi:hypothetical protein [Sporomusa aerivorans]|uniref:hypothetical protein n=1 Tax=Sporomusa aerivorans TaxID=204936 RepID=UPI00352A2211